MALPTLDGLIDTIARKVQDASYGEDAIATMINKRLRYVTSKLWLPALETVSQVVTVAGSSKIDMPVDFQRNLYHARSLTQGSALRSIYRSEPILKKMCWWTWDHAGPVEALAVQDRYLVYQYIPDEPETLELSYLRCPAELYAAGDKPECLSACAELAEDLIVFGACAEIFDEIEDGMDSPPVNAPRYEKRFQQALAEARRQIIPALANPPLVANFC